jgi:hypothetical protein
MAVQAVERALFERRCRVVVRKSAEKVIDRSKRSETVETTTDAVEIGGAQGELGLRVQFDIQKTNKKEPNTAEVVITNLAENTRSLLQGKGVRLSLEAGYRDTGLKTYFLGDVRAVDHRRVGAEWESVIRLGDGERAWQHAKVNESWDGKTQVADVIKRIAEAMGLDGDAAARQFDVAVTNSKHSVPLVFDHGYCVNGSASRAMDRAMKAARLGWSMQDGEIRILAPGQALTTAVYEITPDSGLVGTPEIGSPTKKGRPAVITFVSLLVPVQPGHKVRLRSSKHTGDLVALSVKHSGDTAGNNWYTTVSAEMPK